MIFHLHLIFAITSFTDAVKVNMHGSLNLGKEVMDTISHYLRSGYGPYLLGGRRSLNAQTDLIPLEIKSASFCANLEFCKGNLENFVNDYVTALAQTVMGVFDGILNSKGEKPFFGMLRTFISDVKRVLKATDEKITDEREAYCWVGAVKKISAKFQFNALTQLVDRLEADTKEVDDIKKKLTQTLIIDVTIAEAKAQKRLCHEFRICLNINDCTSALNGLLSRLRKLPNKKIHSFIRAFQVALDDSTFYTKLSPKTAKAFKIILRDMAEFDNVPTKDILHTIQETVETRLSTMNAPIDVSAGQDIHLVHMILSDMDYLYSKHKADSPHSILDKITDWTVNGGKIKSHIRDVIKNIRKIVSNAPNEIGLKLINEVRVFLEVTVEPEK